MHYELRIFPGLVPNDRHQIEDLIDEHLAALGVEVCGGGGLLDGSQSDIAFIASNIEAAREVVKLTQNLEPSSRFELYSSDSNSVIDTFEPSPLQKKWWQFWKL
jgi:hypothetical protein